MRSALLLLSAMLAALSARADQLPFRVYGTTDGLPSTFVLKITRDSRGLLWFATRDGLARFDGSRFVTYGTQFGLPVPTINHVLETRDGTYWVATNGGGVYRVAADAPLSAGSGRVGAGLRAFRLGDGYADRVNVLYEDDASRLWAGSDGGVFLLERPATDAAFRAVPLPMSGPSGVPGVRALLGDGEGGVWIGDAHGLFRRRANGSIVHYPLADSPRAGEVLDLARDGRGRIWVAARRGLLAFVPQVERGLPEGARVVRALQEAAEDAQPDGTSRALPEAPGEARWYRPGDGRLSSASAVCVTSDGHLWAGVGGTLRELTGERWRTYTAANGLAGETVNAIAEDRDGNLWISSRSAGVMKLTRGGFTRYDQTDGLQTAEVHSIHERDGSLLVASGRWTLSRLDGARFTSVTPRGGWATGAWASPGAWLDREGGWWLLTGDGLGRLPKVARLEELAGRSPAFWYQPRSGLVHAIVSRLFEDRRGDIWASGRSSREVGVSRWERATGRWHLYGDADGLPAGQAPGAFVEDATGTLWIGLSHGGLMRWREGRFRPVPQDAFTRAITTAYRDDAGSLWFGSSWDGLLRVLDPTAERPRLRRYTTEEGLASNNVRCLTSDRMGRVYVGTARGVDRLDPDSGRVRHYTTADGLANSFVTVAFRDRAGALWFGTMQGLSRLLPQPERPQLPPPVWIAGVSVNGAPRPLSHLGESAVAGLELGPEENRVRIEFFGLGFSAGEVLRYQYRLEGVDPEWSRPAEAREVHYARLPAGRYRFHVRAVTAAGVESLEPARVLFTVRPPFWWRAWFQAAVLLGLGLLVYGAHRHRLGKALAVERVRTRIASDLHDDIGSTVSRMAILSEVARRQVGATHPQAAHVLEEIGASARGLLDTTGDIVWAIDPRLDDVASLVTRVREFGAGLLEARGIAWDFEAAPEAETARFDPEQRRQLLLIFKEALHNVCRHAACAAASVRVSLRDGRFRAEIRDDGRGFVVDAGAAREGHGLASMSARAAHLGGALHVRSMPGEGTQLTLEVPVRRRDA